MSRHPLLIPTLLLLAGISVWLVVEISHEEPHKTNHSKQSRDYYMEDVMSVVMDKSGAAKYRLTAKKLAHYPKDQHVELTSPVITLYRSAKKNWTISANKGTLFENNNELQLTGDVILNNFLDNSLDKKANTRTQMTIATQAIKILTEQQMASTDMPVSITTERGKISAIGMNLDTANQILELKSNVRGRYASDQ